MPNSNTTYLAVQYQHDKNQRNTIPTIHDDVKPPIAAGKPAAP
jgi:hypothetical protein